MRQTPNKRVRKRVRIPKDITERSGHEIMEIVFGKRVMREVDALVEAGDAKKKSKSSTKKE